MLSRHLPLLVLGYVSNLVSLKAPRVVRKVNLVSGQTASLEDVKVGDVIYVRAGDLLCTTEVMYSSSDMSRGHGSLRRGSCERRGTTR